MLPIRLTIQGLYSYKTRQEIDFSELTHQHLFGIFGAVGSGKSSILDAITFALYGQIERINKTDGLAENIFNQAAIDFLVDFEFESGPEKNRYRFVVKNGRTKKGDPKGFDRSSYKQTMGSNDWEPMDLQTAASVFGLTYENFRRTIIIPQGQFSDFLQLTGGERTKMMLELFPRLAEFDVSAKVSALQTETKTRFDEVQGRLLETGSIETLDPTALEEKLVELNTHLKQSKEQSQVVETEFRVWEELRLIEEQKQQATEKLNQLESQTESFENRKRDLQKHESIVRTFGADLRILDQSRLELNNAKSEKEKSVQTLEQAQIHHDQIQLQYEAAKNESLQVPVWEEEIKGLHRFAEMKSLQTNEKTLAESHQKLVANLDESNGQKQELKNKITESRAKLDSRADGSDERTRLVEVAQIQKDTDRLKSDLDGHEKKKAEIMQAIDVAKGRKDTVLQHALIARIPNLDPELKIAGLIDVVREESDRLRSSAESIRTQQVEEGAKQKLFDFAQGLGDGDACPLCGSVHHPNIVSAEDLTQHLKTLLEKLGIIEKEMAELENQLRILEGVKTEAGLLIKELSEKIADVKSVQKELDNCLELLAGHSMAGLSTDQIQGRLTEIDTQQKEISEIRDLLRKQEADLMALDERIQNQEKERQDVQVSLSKLEGQLAGLERQGSPDDETRFASVSQPEMRIQEIENRIHQTKQTQEQVEIEWQQAVNQLTESKTKVSLYSKQVEEKEKDTNQKEQEFVRKLSENQQESEGVVRAEIARNLNVDSARKEIDSFFQQLNELRTVLDTLEKQGSGKAFDADLHEAARTNLETVRARVSQLEQDRAVTQKELETIRSQREKALELLDLKDKLEIRLANLKVLSSLFSGSKFVNYASSVYLRNVVEVANQRFFRLTKQKLRLVLDEDNTFYVQDFLNNGHQRLAKTLSGGQIFQASLSLALALSDIVNNKNKSERNFFFLDEGFGTLDKESLSLVFETLRQLRTENRIVGVISHVEEMQSEIDACLRIRMDEEKGSVIERRF
jgi:exonuclease SbcC